MSSDSFLFLLLNLDRKSLFQHHNVYCDVCSRSITGIRRKCLTCADIDVCNDCYLRGAHLSQIKLGHNPSSCVFVEIHNQEQTDNFNSWMKGRIQLVTPSVDIPITIPVLHRSAPTQPLSPYNSPHPQIPNPFSQPPFLPDPSSQTPNPFSQDPSTIPFLPGSFGPSVPMMPTPTPRGPGRPLFDPQIFPIHPTFPEHNRDYRNQRRSYLRNDRGLDERYGGNERFGGGLRDQLNNDPPFQLKLPDAPQLTNPFHL